MGHDAKLVALRDRFVCSVILAPIMQRACRALLDNRCDLVGTGLSRIDPHASLYIEDARQTAHAFVHMNAAPNVIADGDAFGVVFTDLGSHAVIILQPRFRV